MAEEVELNQSMRHYTIEVVFIGGRSRIKSEHAPLHHRGGLLAEEAELNQSMLAITPSRWSLIAEEAELNQSMRH